MCHSSHQLLFMYIESSFTENNIILTLSNSLELVVMSIGCGFVSMNVVSGINDVHMNLILYNLVRNPSPIMTKICQFYPLHNLEWMVVSGLHCHWSRSMSTAAVATAHSPGVLALCLYLTTWWHHVDISWTEDNIKQHWHSVVTTPGGPSTGTNKNCPCLVSESWFGVNVHWSTLSQNIVMCQPLPKKGLRDVINKKLYQNGWSIDCMLDTCMWNVD